MRLLLTTTTIFALGLSCAVADDKPSEAEAAKINETLAAWGCKGGDFEKETEDTSVFEVDDAICLDGKQYDIKLDNNFVVRSMTRD